MGAPSIPGIRFAGLDEAALGPRLGPFCAGLVEIDAPDSLGRDVDFYGLLDGAVSADRSGEGIAVGDSKRLYTTRTGIGLLEQSVLVFLHIMGVERLNSLRAWVTALCPDRDAEDLNQAPWFAGADAVTVPRSSQNWGQIEGKARALSLRLSSAGIRFRAPRLRLVTAASFNKAIGSEHGKSGAVRSILNPLISHAIKGPGPDRRRLIVDRQGGRRYYGDWLINLFPGRPIRTGEETAKRSSYSIGAKEIEFLVSADRLRLETALASMFAKYLRELAMAHFNHWWCAQVKDLKPTAGYPGDAERFIKDLRAAGRVPMPEQRLIRLS